MQEILAQVLAHVWGVWRFRWIVITVAWVVALAGWIFVAQMPSQYEASARIHVDSNTVLRPLLRGLAIQPNITQRIQLMSRTLLSRPNLEKLMRMTDLDLTADTEADKDRVVTELRSGISLSGDRENASLYTVSFVDEDRDTAKRVTQSLLTVFIETTLGDEREDSAGAQSFLDDQIVEYEKRLSESEGRLAQFKQKYTGILPGQGGTYYQRLEAERKQLESAQLQLREVEHRRDELKRQLTGEEPVSTGGLDSGLSSSLDGRIASLQTKLDSLLTKYTERHPEVIQTRSLIDELETEKEVEIQAIRESMAGGYSAHNTSPVYQQMRSMLSESEARAAELSVRVSEYKDRVKELDSMVDSIPVIEAELTQLNRDYQVVSQKHSELLSRREAARISEDVERKANDLVFRVIDPPFVPIKPNKPDKLILNSVVLAAALGAGIGVALLLSLLRPVIMDRRILTELTGLPVLGTVMAREDPEARKQEFLRVVAFASLLVVLVLSFAALNFGQQWLLA